MNVLLLSIDSLRRDFLSTYRNQPRGFDYPVETPNLDRFAEKAAVFDTHYAGSLYCMPARREWYTGIQEFLWRPWGPIEPFDHTLPATVREQGALTELITDHYHYFQHGANGYFEDYHGYEFIRGHEYDAWQTTPRSPDEEFLDRINADDPTDLGFLKRAQYARNVSSFDPEEERDFFAPKVFDTAAGWIGQNTSWENWFLYVDSFDVHEPIHCPEPYASMYTDEDPWEVDETFWPYWGHIDRGQSELSDRELGFVRSQFAGKVTMVDSWFGRILDQLDEHGLWEETVVIVTSDHGFSLGANGYIGKMGSPLFNNLTNTPLLIWHPDSPRMGGRISEVTAAVDLYATILDIFGADVPDSVHSQSLHPLLMAETDHHRDWALYGLFGGEVNITDGQYTYHHPCDPTEPTYQHSSVMLDTNGPFQPPDPPSDADAGAFLPYTDVPVWRFASESFNRNSDSLLFDVTDDPAQTEDLIDEEPAAKEHMRDLLKEALAQLDAPTQQYRRLNLQAQSPE